MRSLLAAVLVLVVASTVQAQEAAFGTGDLPPAPGVEAPAPSVVSAESPQQTTVELRTVEAREVTTAGDEASALPVQRGSFWWYVAVVVVAGVILAVIL